MPIESVRHKGLRRLIENDDGRGVRGDQVAKLRRVLFALQEANDPSDMDRYPGWRLHQLTGDRHGMWSVTVTGNWRIVFRFADGNAHDVDLVDYH